MSDDTKSIEMAWSGLPKWQRDYLEAEMRDESLMVSGPKSEAARRERAEKFLNSPDPISLDDSLWARNLAGSFDDDYGVLVGYLAGAREEAAIKNAYCSRYHVDECLHDEQLTEQTETIRDLTDTIAEMGVTLAERAEEIAASRKTAEHWKQEHLAGNEEIAKLQQAVRLVESALMRDLTESGESVTRELLELRWCERPEVKRAVEAER